MDEKTKEWIIQADFDIETAEFMFQGGRYFLCVISALRKL